LKAKISRGSGFRGALDYVLDKKKAAVILGGTMSGSSPGQLAKEFSATRALRPDCSRPVWHCSLTLPAGERLDAQQWQAVALDYMQGMGFDDSRHQYIFARHQDTEHDHIHIVASRIDMEGELWHGKWEVMQAIELCQELEKKHSLTITLGLIRDENHKKGLSQAEIERSLRTDEAPPRLLLQQAIDAALADKPTPGAFIERLQAAGISVRPNVADTGTMNGFSFKINEIPFKGSQLGGGYSWSGLQKRGLSYDKDRDSQTLIRARDEVAQRTDRPDQAAPGLDAGRLFEAGPASRPGAGDTRRLGQDKPGERTQDKGETGKMAENTDNSGGGAGVFGAAASIIALLPSPGAAVGRGPGSSPILPSADPAGPGEDNAAPGAEEVKAPPVKAPAPASVPGMTPAEAWDASILSRRRRKAWDAEKKDLATPSPALKMTHQQYQARKSLVEKWDWLSDPVLLQRKASLHDPETKKAWDALGNAWDARQKEKNAALALSFLTSQRDELTPWQFIEKAKVEEKIRLEKEKKKAAQEEQARILREERDLIDSIDKEKVKLYRWQQEEKREKEKRELLAREAKERLEAEEQERERQRKRAEYAARPKSAKKKSKSSGPTGG
jgi:hypothetical protein